MKWKSGGKLLSNLFFQPVFAIIILRGVGKGITRISENSTGVGIIKILAELLHQSIVCYSVEILLLGES